MLVVEGYRENGKVKHRTLLNISKWKDNQIEAFRKLLKNGEIVYTSLKEISVSEGKKIGGIYTCNEIAKRLGLSKLFEESKLTLMI